MKAYIYFYNEFINYENTSFGGKAILIMGTSEDTYNVRKHVLSHYPGFLIYQAVLTIFKGFNFCKKRAEQNLNKMESIRCEQAPEPMEIQWENIGMASHQRAFRNGMSWVFMFTSLLVCGALIILIAKTLITGLIYIISFIFIFNIYFVIFISVIFILQIYNVIIMVIARKRKGETYTSNAYFILSRTTPF